jgi:hydroxymethylbilane synthase
MNRLRLGTRGSALALAQAAWVKWQLEEHDAQCQVELCIIKTSGDRFIDRPVQNIGGKGIFTKEIEDALRRGEIDLAVHSLKDLPTDLPHDLMIAAVPRREDARDVLISRGKNKLAELAAGARIGTGSLRRRAQLLNRRPELTVVPVRGNIDTRLRKLDEGSLDAIVLAAAGLKRLGREGCITEYLPDEICVSAVAQGALAIESRDAAALRERFACLHDVATFTEVTAERALLDRLSGGCHVPIGARARVDGPRLQMIAVVASPDGGKICRGEISGTASEAVALGHRLAEQLLSRGAHRLLAAV